MRILCEINAGCVPDFGESRILILALLGAKIIGHKEGCVCNDMMQTALPDMLNYGAALPKYGPWNHQLQMILERYKRSLHETQLPKFT